MTDSKTKTTSSTEATQCPFCCETLKLASSECHSCGSDLSLFNPDALGWVTVADYAAATSTTEEAVLFAIRHGDLDGQLICGEWLVLDEDCD
jgi:hypothetical protein